VAEMNLGISKDRSWKLGLETAICLKTAREHQAPPQESYMGAIAPHCNFGHFTKSPRSAEFFKWGGGSDVISLLQAQTT